MMFTHIAVAVPTAVYTAATDYIDGRFDIGEVTGEDEVRWSDITDYLIDVGYPEAHAVLVVDALMARHASVRRWPEAYNP